MPTSQISGLLASRGSERGNRSPSASRRNQPFSTLILDFWHPETDSDIDGYLEAKLFLPFVCRSFTKLRHRMSTADYFTMNVISESVAEFKICSSIPSPFLPSFLLHFSPGPPDMALLPAGTHFYPVSSTLFWEASQFRIPAGAHVEIQRSRGFVFHQGSVLSGICFPPFLTFTVSAIKW